MTITLPVRDQTCCCGHVADDHAGLIGPCLHCGRGCRQFHDVGEGHGLAPKVIFAVVMGAALALGIIAVSVFGYAVSTSIFNGGPTP